MKEIKAWWLFTLLKLRKMWSFKANLISQAVGMIINNIAFLGVWWLLLKRFGNVNGYGMDEIVLIQGYVAIVYAIFYLLLAGTTKLHDYVSQDRFLDLQLYPVNPLAILLTKSGSPSQFGDFIEGTLLLTYYCLVNPEKTIIVFMALLITIIGLTGVSLLTNSLVFYWKGLNDGLSQLVDNAYIGAAMYPSQTYSDTVKYIMMGLLVIPIVSIPIESIRGFTHPSFMVISAIVAIVANILGYFLWQNEVKKVESGSGGGVVE